MRHEEPLAVDRDPTLTAASDAGLARVSRVPGPLTVWTGIGAGMLVLFGWAFWPTLRYLAHAWTTEPDYTHGFLVVPVAVGFLWLRRDGFPVHSLRPAWGGAVFLALSALLRYAGARYYVEPFDGWALILWIGGMVWLLGGRDLTMWASPAIMFLLFMVPLPWTVEQSLAWPMQRVAAAGSARLLQCCGLPAFASGNTVLLEDYQLEVAQACAGLRIFWGITALGFGCAVLMQRPWWHKVFFAISIVPVAIVANIVRIAISGLLHRYTSTAVAERFSHDGAGWLTVIGASAMFGAVIWWVGRAFPEWRPIGQRELLGHRHPEDAAR